MKTSTTLGLICALVLFIATSAGAPAFQKFMKGQDEQTSKTSPVPRIMTVKECVNTASFCCISEKEALQEACVEIYCPLLPDNKYGAVCKH